MIGPDTKLSPTGSPPMSAYPPTAPESYTPTRGPQLFNTYPTELAIPSITRNSAPEQIPEFSEGALPIRSANGSSDNAAPQDSPSSSFPPYTMLSGDQSMFTPAPKRQNPRLAAPSTARLPSSFMFDSSPAPFWKYPGLAGSTPARGIDLSPMKAGPLQSSSPPPIHTNGIESPTRTRRAEDTITQEKESDVGLGVDVGEEEEEVQIDLTRYEPHLSDFTNLVRLLAKVQQRFPKHRQFPQADDRRKQYGTPIQLHLMRLPHQHDQDLTTFQYPNPGGNLKIWHFRVFQGLQLRFLVGVTFNG